MKKAIEDTFGSNAVGHALFYNHPNGLRFELSESGNPSYIHMFLQAYQKAAEITNFMFADARDLHAAICLYSYGDGSFLSGLSRFRSIASCGLKIPKSYHTWRNLDRVGDEEDDRWRTSIAFKIDRTVIPQLLWGAISSDIGIRPRLLGDVYLFDLELGILVHPYDERGMDVIGNNLGILRSAYDKFDRYLLDYDREIMRDRFHTVIGS